MIDDTTIGGQLSVCHQDFNVGREGTSCLIELACLYIIINQPQLTFTFTDGWSPCCIPVSVEALDGIFNPIPNQQVGTNVASRYTYD